MTIPPLCVLADSNADFGDVLQRIHAARDVAREQGTTAFEIRHVEGLVSAHVDALVDVPARFSGTEVVEFPSTSGRGRRPRLAARYEQTWGTIEALAEPLRRLHPSSGYYLGHRLLAPSDCPVLWSNGTPVAWVPVLHADASSAVVRVVLNDPGMESSSPARQMAVRLALMGRAIDRQLDAGRCVRSWIPGNGDIGNTAKASLSSSSLTRRWFVRQVPALAELPACESTS